MNKMAWGASGAVALAAVAVVGGAAWSGRAVQQHLEADMAQIETLLPLKVAESHYEKGLFSATHTVVFKGACEGDDETTVTVRQRIQHGPLPGGTRLGWSVVDTELVMPDGLREVLKEVPADQTLIRAHTVLGLGGGFETQLTVPALALKDEAPVKLAFQALTLKVQGRSLSGGTVTYDLAWPGLSASDQGAFGETHLQVGALTAHGEIHPDPKAGVPWWLAAGQGVLDLQRLEITAQPKSGDKPTKLVFTDMRSSSEATQDKALLTQVSRFKGQGVVNEVKINNLDVAMTVKRIHGPSYAQFLQQAWSPASVCGRQDADPMARAQASMAAMAALLPYDPELSLDKLSMEIDGHAGDLSYALGTQGVTAEEVASPDLRTVLFNKTYASGQAKIPMAWLEKFAVDPQPGRQAQDKAMLDAMVSQAVDSGYVVREGALLQTQFKLDKGQLLVNGKPIGPQLGRP